MTGTIGIIANDMEMKALIEDMYSKEVADGELFIDILDEDRMEGQAKSLEDRGMKVIIARGGPYRHGVGRVEIPIIHMKVSVTDILQAIQKAMETGKKPVLIIWDQVFFNEDDWKGLLPGDLVVERFDHQREIHHIMDTYARASEDYVIIASGIGSKLAREKNMDSVFLNATKDSINDAIGQARNLVHNLHHEKFRNQVLQTILDGVHDAVIAIDYQGLIIRYNDRAKELLKKDKSRVLGKAIEDVFPTMAFMKQVLVNHQVMDNTIMKVNQLTIAANASLIVVDDQVEGVLCAFQDITRLQNLEKKIRLELNKKGLTNKYNFKDIIHHDPAMKSAVAKAILMGETDSTVVLYGESGTGKEMIAQSIHGISPRHSSPFVAVNCAAISESLLESELFGYEEGAFTGARKGGKPGLFELAHGGSVFLDEIASMTDALQAKLLRVLEEKEVMRLGSDHVIPLDIRVIVATNEDLRQKVKDGSFRSDLFYRLSVLELSIPSLRQRRQDIEPIFEVFLDQLSQGHHGTSGFGKEDLTDIDRQRLIAYDWPGNVRELRNMAKRYSLFGQLDMDQGTRESLLDHDHFEEAFIEDKQVNLKAIQENVEDVIIDGLLKMGLTRTEIADKLGISRTALWKKMNRD